MAEKDLETIAGLKFFAGGKFDGRTEVARIVGIMQGNLQYEGKPIREGMVCLRVEDLSGNKFNFDYDSQTAEAVARAFNVSGINALAGEEIHLCYSSRRLEGFHKPEGTTRTLF